jgi:hypothetical protein
MPTSKRKLAEQILYRIYGGVHTTSSPVQIEDVYEAINQKINVLIKAEVFSVTLATGDTIPEGLMTATYENVAVVTYGRKSKAVLPAMPVRLPRNMGVFEITKQPSDCDTCFNLLFIPLQGGQMSLIEGQKLLSNLLGHVGYEVKGNEVVFHKDIIADGINSVDMTLVVADIGSYGDYDILPISSDMEMQVVEDLVKQFAPTPEANKASDNFSNGQKQGGN